jgi:quercetin dioxygenase-like cupin family protein
MTGILQEPRIRYVYDLAAPGDAPDEACSARVTSRKSPSGARPAGVMVTGRRAHVALVRQARGTGHGLTTCPGEKFLYVVQGTLTLDVNGQLLTVSKGHVLHVPAGVPHGLVVGPDEDATLIAVVDTRHDGGSGEEWKPLRDAPTAPQSTNLDGKRLRFVYAIDELDEAPEGPCSAVVTPKNFVSKKSSSYGASLRGEMLQVGVIRKARGSGAKLHTHPNEQFNLVLEGRLVGEIGGYPMEVPAGSLIHMPATVQHCTIASADGDVLFFVVKDTSHGMAGPPVDGIEDGPRYLPGFGPVP